ncbi:DUF805 domain-containing protein [Brevundimonas sp. SORGH_AS_0993]|uniref:DUF805 domain-containing protein n=1 Tax=Brevundimonas sp. SORGH_AS_0993 TaxID=3041794 RepID=UPI00277ECB37|nr:DUF805 domain-containing protein [Brevundimonas sp. SORGH_AS_0993]MDQ1154610.1 uncharacterized membrane protein YhaH (DUF805 family) [Brevundimonas sp. SORGH_AS_0993]
MLSLLRFSGRLGRESYGLLTAVFSGLVFILAAPAGQPFTQLLSAPWMVLGRALDGLVHLSPGPLDVMASLAVALPLLWLFCALTVGRLRDLGQSLWWTVLVVASGVTVPIMIALSLCPSAETRSVESASLRHA